MTSQFVSALELATYFDGTTDESALTAEWIAQANLLMQMISADIETAAGVKIDAGSGTVRIAGTWSRELELPSGPVRSVSSVSVNGIALDAAGWYWNDRALLLRGTNPLDMIDVDSDPSPLSRQGAHSRSGRSWGGPNATIGINYAWGFVEVPDFLRSLTLRIAARTFGNVQQITQESLAIYSVSYGQSSNVNDGSHVTDKERKRLRKILNRAGGTIVPLGR